LSTSVGAPGGVLVGAAAVLLDCHQRRRENIAVRDGHAQVIVRITAATLALLAGAPTLGQAQGTDKYERVMPPRAAPVPPTPTKPAVKAPAPLAEIQRKASVGERENGLCAGTGWSRRSTEEFLAFLEKPRGYHSFQTADDGCRAQMIAAIGKAQGEGNVAPDSGCVIVATWFCKVGAECGFDPTRHFCRTIKPLNGRYWQVNCRCRTSG